VSRFVISGLTVLAALGLAACQPQQPQSAQQTPAATGVGYMNNAAQYPQPMPQGNVSTTTSNPGRPGNVSYQNNASQYPAPMRAGSTGPSAAGPSTPDQGSMAFPGNGTQRPLAQ